MNKRSGTNAVIQSERRRLLIDATITAIYQFGLSNVTLAKIAALAGLTAGSVNFHFDNKETLLRDTLTFLVEEFGDSIDRALAETGDDPGNQLAAMFEASLNPSLTEARKMAVWFAFSSEARSREDYRHICGDQDRKIFAITLRLCDSLIKRGNKHGQMNAPAMANAVQGLINEIWEEIFDAGDGYNREHARQTYLSFLASVFPWAYTMPADYSSALPALKQSDKSLKIVRASNEHLAALGTLFDAYRQFYDEPADISLARKFIGDNIKKDRSIIFIALDRDGTALGFTQLYPGLCSVATKPFYTLYDLYVSAEARGRGVGRELMNEAEKYARKMRACRLDLETAIDNYPGQSLYESLGYERDKTFYKYSLALE